MADVKELMVGLFFRYVYIKDKKLNYLIFYQLKRTNSRDFEPEFLASTKKFDLGEKQQSVVVFLPTWAKDDPIGFFTRDSHGTRKRFFFRHI